MDSVKVRHVDHDDEMTEEQASLIVQHAAVAFLHRELQKVDSITLTDLDFDLLHEAIPTGQKVGELGILFSLGPNHEVILTAVKKKDDA